MSISSRNCTINGTSILYVITPRLAPIGSEWGDAYPHQLYDNVPQQHQQQQQQHYDPREDSELAKTANELLGTVDDPKFSNTEVLI